MRDLEPHSVTTIGPNIPIASGPMQLRLSLNGEKVLNAKPVVGFLHRGIEKIAEKMTWAGFLPFTDRIDYVAATFYNLSYALAVENLGQIKVSDRANVIRTIVAELSRISSHLFSFHMVAKSIGADSVMYFSLREREKINDLFEMLAGSRLTHNYIRIGGVAADITEGFSDKTDAFLRYLKFRMSEYEDLFFQNPIVRGRLKGLGIVSEKACIQAGVTGPILRATGNGFDLRKKQPYLRYANVAWDDNANYDVTAGDAYDRCRTRFFEIDQSAKIIKSLIEAIPSGEHIQPVSRVFKLKAGSVYAAVEGPRGVIGTYIQSTGEKKPYRLKLKTPSFHALNLFPDCMKNMELEDVTPLMASLDILVSEVDR